MICRQRLSLSSAFAGLVSRDCIRHPAIQIESEEAGKYAVRQLTGRSGNGPTESRADRVHNETG